MFRRNAGFTLIEAMLVLSVVAITAIIALPGFSGVIERNRVTTAMHRLSADMALARNSAIMRRDQIVVCPRDDGGYRCANDGDWSRGWLVILDPDRNRQPDADSDILRVADRLAGEGSGIRLHSSRPYLRYQQDGRSAATNLTVHVCTRDMLGGKVIVNNTGRVRTERPASDTPCPR